MINGIAASSAAAGAAEIALYDVSAAAMDALAGRLIAHYPKLPFAVGANDPSGFYIAVNAAPLGTYPVDPMPIDVVRLTPSTFIAEVVMKHETTAFLAAARARGCKTQAGVDMLFEQIPACPSATPDALRAVAQIDY
ncbi:hypothetical protein [Roseiarcus sp.]|uniref:hypothetical protein n=1 Tax=Roseiarcus sp. TaxID=1969460 RepID=UPI003F9CF737